MKKTVLFLSVLVLLAVILAGCTQNTTDNNPNTNASDNGDLNPNDSDNRNSDGAMMEDGSGTVSDSELSDFESGLDAFGSEVEGLEQTDEAPDAFPEG